MARVSDMLREHGRIFERPEFRCEERGARILFEFSGSGVSWLASSEGERLVLRPSQPGDLPPHLVVGLSDDDFLRHMTGELDLFCSIEPRMSFRHPDHGTGLEAAGLSREDVGHLAKRVLSVLSLSEQCSGPFRGGVVEELYLADRSPREDGGWEPMGNWSLPYYAGETLYRLIVSGGHRRTLEVGMAHGLSTLFMAQALKENGGGRHVAIDPWQTRGFGRSAMVNVERAGLAEHVELMEEPNYTALPKLFAEGEGSFQLAFIDGLHIFDHVVLDFFYCDLLVGDGGYVVFDDSTLPAVRSAIDFLLENRSDSYERVEERCTERITVLRKTAADQRVERYGPAFHRPFSGAGPEVAPLPAPPRPHVLKSVFDRVLALVVLVALSPLLLVIAAAVVLDGLLAGDGLSSPFAPDPGVSAGRTIGRLRFRTKRRSGEPSRTGAVVGKLGLAALPSVWNVLAGEMSFVGPKPIARHEHVRRQLFRDCGLRAGLTGFQHLRGQGDGGHGSDYYEEFVGRGQLSLLGLDLSILARSAAAFVARRLPSSSA